MIKSSHKGPIAMAAAATCWSIGGLCLKFIPWSAMSIIGLRALLAAAVYAVYRKNLKISLTRGNIMAAVFQSATTILFVFATKRTTAAAAVMLQFTAPIHVLLINFIMYKQKPKPSEALAVLFTLMGMLLFFADQLDSGKILGNVLALFSGVAFAFVFVFNRRLDTDPQQSVMLSFLINATIFTPFAFFDKSITADIVPWAFIILLGCVQVGFAYIFFSIGIKRTSALLSSLILALEPVLTPVWVAIFHTERPGRYAIAGSVVIVLTIVFFNVWVAKRMEN